METVAHIREIRRTIMNCQHTVDDMLLDLAEEWNGEKSEIKELAKEVWDALEAVRKKVYQKQVEHEQRM